MARGIIGTVLAVCVLLTPLVAAPEPRVRIDPQPPASWENVQGTVRASATATRINTMPKVDGTLDEPFWATCAAIETFSSQVNLPEEAKKWVTTRVAFDQNALYIGAKLVKPGGSLRMTVAQDGGRIWSDDCFEIYLGAPGSDFFYQIDVNGLGVHWAGASKGDVNWAPALKTAAKVNEKDWTVEISIPWSDLGVKEPGKVSLPFELRYLTASGASCSAWAAGNRNLTDFGTLRTVAGPAAADMIRFTRFSLPGRLPVGRTDRAVEVEAQNPSTQPRQAVARLVNSDNSQVVAQEIVVVPAKGTQTIALPLTLAAREEKKLALHVKDAQGDLRSLALRRVAAMAPLSVSLHRERAWTDDAKLSADVLVGVPATQGERLQIELWDDMHRIERAECPLGGHAFALSVDLTGLPPGKYRLRSAAQRETLISEVTLPSGTALPERQTIPLRIQWPDGPKADGDHLLYAGVSFPAGMLHDTERVRVVDNAGREVPSQSEVLARWSPNGSIKWIGLRFPGRQGTEYAAEVGAGMKRAVVPAAPVKVEETADALRVNTGAAQFELPKIGPLISRAAIGGKPAIESKGGCLIVSDQNGRMADETLGKADEAPMLEVAGPVAAIVRREGLLRTAQGERLGKYVVRLTFSAGSPFIFVQHTFVNTENTNQTQYSDIALRLRPAFAGPLKMTFGNDERTSVQLDSAAGDGAYMFQSLYKHHLQPKCEYSIGQRRGAKGEWTRVAGGEVAGDWAAVSGPGAGLAVSIAHMAQMFPKEIEVGPEGLTAHLWSSRSGRNLDYRAPAISEYFGTDWFERLYPGGLKGFNATYTDAAGSARTHDLLVQLLPADAAPAQVASVARLASTPVLAIQDPAWLRDSNAMGPLHPRDPQNFPQIESYIQKYFALVDKRADTTGDYGFLDYGNGPHTYGGGPRLEGRPRFYRYYEMDYQWRTVLWQLYARSGDRAIYDYALRYNRHLNDFLFSWWSSKNKPLGAMLTTGDGEVPLYWRSRATFWGSQGINLNNAFYHFYLSGDRRVLDGARAYGDYMAANFDPLTLPNAVAGANHNPYECLVDLYGATWDERFGTLLRACRERMVDLDTGSGLVNQAYYGAWYKPHIRVWVHFKDYLVTGSELARKASEKWFAQMLMYEPINGPGYQNYDGIFMNYAWQLTGDPRYASWAAERIARVEYAWRDSVGKLNDLNQTDGGHLLTFLGSAPFALDLISRAKDQLQPWPLMPAGADVYFVKEREDSARLALRCRATPELFLTRAYEKLNEEMRAGFHSGPVEINLRPYYFDSTLEGGTVPNYAEVRLPKDAFAGEYRLSGAASVLETNAKKIVLVAPEGVLLPVVTSRAPAWHFQLPRGKKGALYANKPVTLEWAGNKMDVPAGEWQALSGGEADVLCALRPTESTFVRFQGDIPPVLAQGDPARFFLPKAAPAAMALAELEDRKATFVSGLSGKEGDKGFLLNPGRTLELPRGKTLEQAGRFERLDAKHGTLEFWLKPQWTTGLLPPGARKQIIRSNAWQLAYENGAFVYFGQAAVMVYPYQHQMLFNRVVLEQGRWYHIALCWDFDPARKMWVSELYVNGRPSGTDQGRPGVGLTRCGANDKQFTNLDVAAPSGPLVLAGEADAVIDEVRLSAVPRYPKPFAPVDPKPFELDKDTLLLMHLNGDQTVEP